MRHNPATVVVLAGQVDEQVLAAIGRSLNVVLVRPESPADAGDGRGGGEAGRGGAGAGRASGGDGDTGVEAATGALRRAAGISAPYVLVAADPLAGVAAAWRSMWQVTAESRGGDEFEFRAAEVMAAWRAKRFELPDYYLVLTDQGGPGGGAPGRGAPGRGAPGRPRAPEPSTAAEGPADFYLGPLRAVRPNRVAVAAGASPAAQADALLSELGSLRQGPWWPSLDDVLRTARGFYPGSLAESTAGQATLLS